MGNSNCLANIKTGFYFNMGFAAMKGHAFKSKGCAAKRAKVRIEVKEYHGKCVCVIITQI